MNDSIKRDKIGTMYFLNTQIWSYCTYSKENKLCICKLFLNVIFQPLSSNHLSYRDQFSQSNQFLMNKMSCTIFVSSFIQKCVNYRSKMGRIHSFKCAVGISYRGGSRKKWLLTPNLILKLQCLVCPGSLIYF